MSRCIFFTFHHAPNMIKRVSQVAGPLHHNVLVAVLIHHTVLERVDPKKVYLCEQQSVGL